MLIERSSSKDGNLLPNAINVVNSIPETLIYNGSYYLRKPEIILNLSYKRIFRAFNNTLNLEHELQEEYAQNRDALNPKFEQFGELIMEVLESINSYIEDCMHIFKCTTPVNDKNLRIKKKFVSQWLKQAKHPTSESFYNSIKEYRDEIAHYTNQYKHEHGRIDVLVGKKESRFSFGYIMKYIGDTPQGPLETLDLSDVKCVLLDLQYHFYQFYRISECFSFELLKAIKVFHSVEIELKKIEKDFDEFDNIIEKLQIKNLLVFPNNEIVSPKVLIEREFNSLKLQYPFGITQENTEHVRAFRIKDKPFAEYKLLAVPTKDSIRKIRESKTGDRLFFNLDDRADYLKIFLQIRSLGENVGTFLKLNYDDLLEFETYTNMGFQFISNPDTFSNLHVKIPKVDYLGIKMELKQQDRPL